MAVRIAPEVAAYFARIEQPGFRNALESLRAEIRALVPDADEVISYGLPTFDLDGHLVALGAFRRHLSFFPLSSTLLGRFAADLEGFKTSAGTVQFLPGKPLPSLVVAAMVGERIAENAEIAFERRARAVRR